MNERCKSCMTYHLCLFKGREDISQCFISSMAYCENEPDDYDGKDIGSATVEEMRLQNGDY